MLLPDEAKALRLAAFALAGALAGLLLAWALALPHPVADSSLWKNAYWPFTVELSVRDR